MDKGLLKCPCGSNKAPKFVCESPPTMGTADFCYYECKKCGFFGEPYKNGTKSHAKENWNKKIKEQNNDTN